ncbi:MAG: tRNA uridine-5-carboxymethylaminomethyl(34) synthesis GTPase MnmE [Pseudomonadota bacterium]|nr:tRNA uridine-5-carboxymethylaminomethyl(34) synthesis GTPase MnmE [Pseudomonadota bacterium]
MATTGQGETIYAEATASGVAGVAIVRLSGPKALDILEGLAGPLPSPRKATLRRLISPSDGDLIDQALVLWFPKPHSFTGEDVAELHLHGGRAVVDSLFNAIQHYRSVRLADPGEFSRRAFVNGKLDLTAAEGLADLVASETDAQRRQALRQLSGELGALYEQWRIELLQAQARIEAALDFVEEDVPTDLLERVRSDLALLLGQLRKHLDDGRRGEIVRGGLRLVIAGAPNVGKSSVINRLCGREVSIVYPSVGTTRDVIEADLRFEGLPVTISDTAGIRNTSNPVEKEGIRRANLAVAAADILILVFDSGVYPAVDEATLSLARESSCLVFNKMDTIKADKLPTIEGLPVHHVSCTTGEGIQKLTTHLSRQVRKFTERTEGPLLTRARHREALGFCVEGIERTTALNDPELIAEELRTASAALGRITGRVGVEDVLDLIFSEFCIGK